MSSEDSALRTIKRYRRQVDRLEDAAIMQMASAFRSLQSGILGDLRKLGKPDPLPMNVRYEQVIGPQIVTRLDQYVYKVDAVVTKLSHRTAELGAASADESAKWVVPKEQQTWKRINVAGLFTGGVFSAGLDALRKIPSAVSGKIGDLVTQAMGMAERGLDWLMSQVGDILSGAWSGFQRIIRTLAEQLFRKAQQEQRRQTPVQRWRRVANHETACLACLMLEGTVYERFEDFSDHPNGRCYVVPCEPGAQSEPTGRQWLEEQDDATQRRILGKTRYEAWKAGDLSLDQMTDVRPDATFGPQPHVIPLRDLGLTAGK